MILIYAYYKDGSQTLLTKTRDLAFDVQAWANKNSKNFYLLGIIKLTYETIGN